MLLPNLGYGVSAGMPRGSRRLWGAVGVAFPSRCAQLWKLAWLPSLGAFTPEKHQSGVLIWVSGFNNPEYCFFGCFFFFSPLTLGQAFSKLELEWF